MPGADGSPFNQTWLTSSNAPNVGPYRVTASFRTSPSVAHSKTSSRVPAASWAGPSRMSFATSCTIQLIGVNDHYVDLFSRVETLSVGNNGNRVGRGDGVKKVRTLTSNTFDVKASIVVRPCNHVNQMEFSVTASRQRRVENHRKRRTVQFALTGEQSKCGAYEELKADERRDGVA